MGRRIDVEGEIPPLPVPRRILNELYAHALETLPEECCGLIIGGDGAHFSWIVRCRNEMTQLHHADPEDYPRDGRHAFHMNALDYKRVMEQLAPADGDYEHNARWGDGNGFSHVRSALMRTSLTLPIVESKLRLGTWQQIVVINFDNRAREREICGVICGV